MKKQKVIVAALAAVSFTAFAEPTGCPDFEVEAPRASGGPVLNAADFGVSEAFTRNAEAANRLFAEARRVQASRVVFPRGVYRCFDGAGLLIAGLTNCVVDCGGSTFVFRRTMPDQSAASEIFENCGNVEIRDCLRAEVRDLNVDWDWKNDPLGVWARCVDAVEKEADNESYLDFELEAPHPKYPDAVPVQLITAMEEDRSGPRLDRSYAIWGGTTAGSMGMKSAWLSPTKIRVWPGVRPTCGCVPLSTEYRYGAGNNRSTVRRVRAQELGSLFAISHHYYGLNAVVMTSNRHFTLRNVEIWGVWGMGVQTCGAQKWWQLVNVNIRSKPGEKYPVTTTADAHHVVQSQGYAKMIGCTTEAHRDDHLNYHDRTTIAQARGPREVEVVNNRGVGYTLFRPGTLIRLRQQDFADTGWTGRIVSIDGNFVRFDRDLPEQKGILFVLVDTEYATENFMFKNCRFSRGLVNRGLILGNNLTFDSCTFGPSSGDALRFQTCYTYTVWCEGVGCRNVVVRNCRFENLRCSFRVAGQPCALFSGLRLPWKKSVPEPDVRITHPTLAKDVAAFEAKGVPPKPDASAIGDMLVEGCTFVNPRGYLWYIMNGDGYWFRDNKVVWDDPSAPRAPNAGRIRVDADATNVHVPAELVDAAQKAGAETWH